jgi:hypothetical protein
MLLFRVGVSELNRQSIVMQDCCEDPVLFGKNPQETAQRVPANPNRAATGERAARHGAAALRASTRRPVGAVASMRIATHVRQLSAYGWCRKVTGRYINCNGGCAYFRSPFALLCPFYILSSLMKKSQLSDCTTAVFGHRFLTAAAQVECGSPSSCAVNRNIRGRRGGAHVQRDTANTCMIH